ncbi:hypothetical protein [Pseudogemmobacter faecipullorum]|uniref:Lipoprotein n=1 Tax=Pseudogemmobacter faecipullorum TaxID=2755041 RepID=A0ABS8CKN2_9RHOB|nr:hypothetical protein [Pseudogemmobacter faecipullorum]MCB5409953.1 hypothetical protein [Pseudogemmobacter faecipullorum]
MKLHITLSLLLLSTLAGCVDEAGGNGGYLTHSEHQLNMAETAQVQSRMSSLLKQPVQLSGMKATYRLSDGAVPICGYVSNGASAPAIFGGVLNRGEGGAFAPYNAPGKGQDPARIAAVRGFCLTHHIAM